MINFKNTGRLRDFTRVYNLEHIINNEYSSNERLLGIGKYRGNAAHCIEYSYMRKKYFSFLNGAILTKQKKTILLFLIAVINDRFFFFFKR